MTAGSFDARGSSHVVDEVLSSENASYILGSVYGMHGDVARAPTAEVVQAMSGSLRVFGGPGRYLQGEGAIEQMGAHVARLGRRTGLLADGPVLGLVSAGVAAACDRAGVECVPVTVSGDITPEEIDRFGEELESAIHFLREHG